MPFCISYEEYLANQSTYDLVSGPWTNSCQGCEFLPQPTPTATQGCSENCDVMPPRSSESVTVNGVAITSSYSGSVLHATGGFLFNCNICSSSADALYVGFSGPFSYTMYFDKSVSSVSLAILGTGEWGRPSDAENFVFSTNSGNPTIAADMTCGSNISGNQIYGALGGIGKVSIYNAMPFSQLTISGDGGLSGSTISICSLTKE